MEPSHVLVALDGSPLADDALSHALATFDCKITVLNVVDPLDARLSEGGVLERDDQRETAARQRAEKLVDRARARATTESTAVETRVTTGDPAECIIAFAEAEDVDHIVMGGHGGSGGRLARRLLGTVATAVVGEAPVTVTVVR